VQALIEKIRRNNITADIVLAPGDLTNRVSAVGMMQAWDHLREVQRELHAASVLCTLGNHDVDAKKQFHHDPFKIPRELHPEFPLAFGDQRNSFWANGFFAHSVTPLVEFVILNTVIDHHDESTAKRGTFNQNRIAHLKQTLDYEATATPPAPVRIAVMHHHPILHSGITTDSKDVLSAGDELLETLAEHGVRLVIHGHKHDPRITRTTVAGREMFVFATGSFSAFLKELASTTRNLFHILNITVATNNIDFDVVLNSWEFNCGDGWNVATKMSARFPHIIGFSTAKDTLNIDALVAEIQRQPSRILEQPALTDHFPQLSHFLPEELESLRVDLHSRYRVKLVISALGVVETIGMLP
jgi:3',5'-cyclic AMP phosphodiesterase CpdA